MALHLSAAAATYYTQETAELLIRRQQSARLVLLMMVMKQCHHVRCRQHINTTKNYRFDTYTDHLHATNTS